MAARPSARGAGRDATRVSKGDRMTARLRERGKSGKKAAWPSVG
jgi:hypothetical protein